MASTINCQHNPLKSSWAVHGGNFGSKPWNNGHRINISEAAIIVLKRFPGGNMRSAASCCFLHREGKGRRDNEAIRAPFTVGSNGRDGGPVVGGCHSMLVCVWQDIVWARWNWKEHEKYKIDGCVATHMGRLGFVLKGVSDGRNRVITQRISELKYHPQPPRQLRQRYSFSAGRAPP